MGLHRTLNSFWIETRNRVEINTCKQVEHWYIVIITKKRLNKGRQIMLQLDGRQHWHHLCNMYPSHPGTQWHWPFTWWINSILFNTFHLAPTKGQCTWDWIAERAVGFCSTQPSGLVFMIRSNWLSCANPSNWGWGVNYYSMYRIMYCMYMGTLLKCLNCFQSRLYSTVPGFWMSATLITGVGCQQYIRNVLSRLQQCLMLSSVCTLDGSERRRKRMALLLLAASC